MIKDICKIETINEPFFENTTLDVFQRKEDIVSLIYGKNGSGKTTISNLINDISNGKSFSFFKDCEGNKIDLGEDKKRIFVFNENYIDENVRASTDKDGVNAILLFGEVASIDEEIKKNEEIIKKEEKSITNRDTGKYDNPKSDFSVEKAKNSIKSFLQGSWASNQQSIKCLSKKAPVKDQIVEKVIEGDPKKIKISETRTNYASILKSIKGINSESEQLPEINISFGANVSETIILEKLNAVYDKKIIDNLSKNIVDITNKKGKLNDLKELLSDNESICPICLRPLDGDYKASLENAVKNAFDATVENEMTFLSNVILSPVTFDSHSVVEVCDSKMIEELINNIEKYNGIIIQYKNFIELKKQNIHESLGIVSLGLQKTMDNILKNVAALNKTITEHNETIRSYQLKVETLESLNIDIAIYEAASIVAHYKNLISQKEKDLKLDAESKKKIEESQKIITALNLRKSNFDIAKDEINRELALIFNSRDRLFLHEGDDSSIYYVYSKGKKIKLKKLSTGERNVIALCYFFEQLKNNCKVGEYFKENQFIVIDDPISSFDYENKLSVISYLSKMIELILNGNKESKIIIMSHERNAIYSLNRLLDLIRLNDSSKIMKTTNRITNKHIINMNIKNDSNYSYLMAESFEFACCDPNEPTFESKGNEIRKMLEAYSTFNYKCGIPDLFSKDQYLNKVSDSKLKEYFKRSLNDLIDNFGSHLDQQTKQFPDLNTFDMFSEEEQVKHARDIMCYLYELDRNHVQEYLGDEDVKVIEQWISDINNLIKDAS